MPVHVPAPTVIPAEGNLPKLIEEFFGRVNTNDSRISVARMSSPRGWQEPGQRPEFDEFTLVLKGVLHVEHENGLTIVPSGQAIHAQPGEWVRYSTPEVDTEYIAICLPAFSPESVHRDEQGA